MSNRCIKLTLAQLKTLSEAEKDIQTPKLWKRIQCLKMRNARLNQEKIAEVLEVRPETIRNWLKTYQSEGIKALLTSKYKGRTPQLEEADYLKLYQWHTTVAPFEKAEDLQCFIAKYFGVHFHLHWVQKLAREKLGIDFRRARKRKKYSLREACLTAYGCVPFE